MPEGGGKLEKASDRRRCDVNEGMALNLGLLFRTLAPMRSRDNMRACAQGIDAMGREEAAYWLGMAMHRRNPRRVLAALRLLLTDAQETEQPQALAANGGGATLIDLAVPEIARFQSTPPRGGDRASPRYRTRLSPVSIPAPAGGRRDRGCRSKVHC